MTASKPRSTRLGPSAVKYGEPLTDAQVAAVIERKLRAAGLDNLEHVSSASDPTGLWAVYLRFGAYHVSAMEILRNMPRVIDVHISPAAAQSKSIICFGVEADNSAPEAPT